MFDLEIININVVLFGEIVDSIYDFISNLLQDGCFFSVVCQYVEVYWFIEDEGWMVEQWDI